MLDIFNNDAFSVTSLTLALRDVARRPSRVRDMGLFTSEGINTTTVSIERVGDHLQIVTPTPRGGPGETRDGDKREMGALPVPHFQRDWSVYADEVQGVRAFGSETVLETVQGKVAAKLADNVADLDATDELSKLGAVQGIVSYKGGKTLNLFTTFGVTQAAEIDFDFANRTNDGSLRKLCTQLIRSTRAGLNYAGFGHLHALVGDNFFDDLLQAPEIRATFAGTSEAAFLRDSYVGKDRGENPIFEFGGIVFENYGAEGSGDSLMLGIPTDKAKFFPVGVPGLFRTYWAPADYEETVNTMGLEHYAKQWPMQNGKGRNGETQSNVLNICTRPAALLSAKRAA